jgi:hypothetical protein
MLPPVEDHLSEADSHLIAAHQLGSLLSIFRQQPTYSKEKRMLMMATAHCPRCEEPFAARERFCKHCGIRRGRPERYLWMWVWVICDLLIVGLCTGVHHSFTPFKGVGVDFADGLYCFGPVLNVVLLLLPFPTWYFTYQRAVLRQRGVATRGKVIENETRMVGRHGDIPRFFSTVEFEADLNPPLTCRAERASFFKRMGTLPIGSEVDVVYDPYGPRQNARVSGKPSLAGLALHFVLCVILSCLMGAMVFLLIFF